MKSVVIGMKGKWMEYNMKKRWFKKRLKNNVFMNFYGLIIDLYVKNGEWKKRKIGLVG